jgi:hypothetical protein
MKHKKTYMLIFLTVLVIFSSGCSPATQTPPTPTDTLTPPPPTPTSPPVIQSNDGIILGTNLNCPDRSSFGDVSENIPTGNALVGSPVLFRWYYAAAEGPAPDWANVCVPTSFTLYLAAGPDYNIANTYSITPTTAKNLVNLLMYSFDLNDALQPHTSYRWMVVGHANGIDIGDDRLPLFQDESAWKLINNTSQMTGQFQTGPACDPQSISPPNLIQPPDQAALDTDTPFFQWDMPNCSAMAYWLSFDTDPQMNSIDIGWVTGQEGFLMFQGGLQPCVIYNWQVQAGLYSTSYHLQNGDWSTASEIRSFIIRDQNCPNALVVPSATPTSPPTATFIPTRVPTKTPKPTSTPVICSNQATKESCDLHSAVCYWYIPPTGGLGECKAKP